MSRQVWHNSFMLWEAPLVEANRQGLSVNVAKKYFPKSIGLFSAGVFSARISSAVAVGPMPICLRWASDPYLGFPRVPFQVWRRARVKAPVSISLAGPFTSTTSSGIYWGFEPVYEVILDAAPAAGNSLTFQAFGQDARVLPGQSVTVSAAGKVGFRCPGIQYIVILGNGAASNVQLVTQDDFANLQDWQKLETVGFPFDKGEIAPPKYAGDAPQGFEAPALKGIDAAFIRLDIASQLQTALPNTGVATIPTPAWPNPLPAGYLGILRGAAPSPLSLVQKCLQNTNDANMATLQVNFMDAQALKGIQQANIPGNPATNANSLAPVVGITMLGVSSDYYASTGLGYGTIDIPPPHAPDPATVTYPPGSVLLPWDYMVTAPYVLPFGTQVELAALAQLRPDPTPANGLHSTIRHMNRPAHMDGPYSAAVRLAWSTPAQPQSAGVLVSLTPGISRLLNHRRPSAVGGYDPYFAPGIKPDPKIPPEDLLPSFTDSLGPVPNDGSRTSTYMVIATDVCGRWSDWRQVLQQFNAPDVLQPGLHSAKLLPDLATAAGHVVHGNIEIEFSWDWADRSADRVEFYSKFYPPAVDPGVAAPNTFQLASNAAPGIPVVVKFDAAQNPSISSGHAGTVVKINASLNPQPNSDLRKYRLTLFNAIFDFTGQKELASAFYAAGAEHLRPANLSKTTGPVKAHEFDPVPPSVKFAPAQINWTALPDATGRARGIMQWDAGDNAEGYFIWEATETALRYIIDPALPDPAPGTPLLARAQALKTLINNYPDKSLNAFARLNRDPIQALQTEVELPSGANTLFAFRISSISATHKESGRSSGVAFFCVPRLMKPGQPVLMLRSDPQGIRVIAFPKQGFVQPAGFRVFRVRREGLAGELGTMGPARILENAAWQPYSETPPRGGPAAVGVSIVDTDPKPSWQPYFYRIVAVGPEDKLNGEWKGESLPSAVARAFRTPTAPPMLQVAHVFAPLNSSNQVIIFITDLPTKATPLGTATIELYRTRSDTTTGKTNRTLVRSWEPKDVEVGLTIGAPILNATPAQLAAMPEIRRSQPPVDSSVATYEIRAARDLPAENDVTFTLTVRDPLGRITETTF